MKARLAELQSTVDQHRRELLLNSDKANNGYKRIFSGYHTDDYVLPPAAESLQSPDDSVSQIQRRFSVFPRQAMENSPNGLFSEDTTYLAHTEQPISPSSAQPGRSVKGSRSRLYSQREETRPLTLDRHNCSTLTRKCAQTLLLSDTQSNRRQHYPPRTKQNRSGALAPWSRQERVVV